MFDQTDIQRLFLKNNYIKDQWENLLLDSGIQKKQIEDFQHLDQTLGIYHK
ncbi:[citrate (pro-3S)-lyase] ligase, partial [Enterococcus faecium]